MTIHFYTCPKKTTAFFTFIIVVNFRLFFEMQFSSSLLWISSFSTIRICFSISNFSLFKLNFLCLFFSFELKNVQIGFRIWKARRTRQIKRFPFSNQLYLMNSSRLSFFFHFFQSIVEHNPSLTLEFLKIWKKNFSLHNAWDVRFDRNRHTLSSRWCAVYIRQHQLDIKHHHYNRFFMRQSLPHRSMIISLHQLVISFQFIVGIHRAANEFISCVSLTEIHKTLMTTISFGSKRLNFNANLNKHHFWWCIFCMLVCLKTKTDLQAFGKCQLCQRVNCMVWCACVVILVPALWPVPFCLVSRRK